ncbi:SAM-dependent methyltransferase [Saccharothrix tamanrassetensis]|uniref:SAM-dependent methyltransferase n=1 Tax=Saccharothrix tamanrassetensis TaxID=1051531 RepID=A0A841CT41_9PSEU|nr:SAM-dependent methyltransferase [Saccharothrix tamanrassetensis]
MALPSSARVYDYLLGGGHNFAVDRDTGEQLARVLPVRDMVRFNRSYLRRAVLAMVEAGITQFLDLGSGIPTVGNVHEVAQFANPACRVVYVDIEPIAVTHSALLLADNPDATAILADLRKPDAVVDAPESRSLLDFSRPVGLLAVGVLHFLPDFDDPWGVLARYRDLLASGSHLAISHFTSDRMPREMAAGADIFERAAEPITPRTRAQVLSMMDGFEIVAPGLVFTPEWRPEAPEDVPSDPGCANLYAVVGRKP